MPQAAIYDHIEAVELSKLVPPVSAASDWQRIVTMIQKFGEETAAVAQLMRRNEIKAAQPTFLAARQNQTAFTKLAGSEGFKVCSGP